MARKWAAIAGAAIVLAIIGGILLYTQPLSGPSSIRDGPGTLYFYAVW